MYVYIYIYAHMSVFISLHTDGLLTKNGGVLRSLLRTTSRPESRKDGERTLVDAMSEVYRDGGAWGPGYSPLEFL